MCAIVFSNDDPQRAQILLNPATPLEEVIRIVKQIVKQTGWEDADDVVRLLRLHTDSFRGEESEIEDIKLVLDRLGDITIRRQVRFTWVDWPLEGRKGENKQRERAEKALHRLVVLGVVQDYTIDYGSAAFTAQIAGATQEAIAAAFGRCVGAYQRRLGEQAEQEALALRQQPHGAYVLAIAERLIRFIYQHVELAWRRALNEMFQAAFQAAESPDQDKVLRQRILAYLEQSEWDERLEQVRGSARGGVDALGPVLDDLVTLADAVALRGAVARALSSYPDVPRLLLLRALAEALSPGGSDQVMRENVQAALTFALEKFQLSLAEVAIALGQIVDRAVAKEGATEQLLQASWEWAAAHRLERDLWRALLPHVLVAIAISLAWRLNVLLTERGAALRTVRKGAL